MASSLSIFESDGVALLGNRKHPSGVTFAFTTRGGGVSPLPYGPLNLAPTKWDGKLTVIENRRRTMKALDALDILPNLINPKQVHGDKVVVVRENTAEALRSAKNEASAGADAVVCTAPDVPVLLCFADCVPIILIADGAFAVVHSGWKGTELEIVSRAVEVLSRESSQAPSAIEAYVGPHIPQKDYEVSPELVSRFSEKFSKDVCDGRLLDLGACVKMSLLRSGVAEENITESSYSTANTELFFSHRLSFGKCGRFGALAFMNAKEQ